MDQTTTDDALITTFGRLIEAQSRLGKLLGRALEQEADVPHTWFEVLLRVSRADGGRLSMGVLADEVALTSGGVTRLVDRMIEGGLLTRVPCPTDRRVYFAALTRSGRDTLDRATAVHARNLRRVFAGFSAQDLRRLDDLLDRLRDADLA